MKTVYSLKESAFEFCIFKKAVIVLTMIVLVVFTTQSKLYSQPLAQTVRGKVFDNTTHEPLPFATLVIQNTNPLIGTATDIDGNFEITKVAVGRINIRVDMLGYESYIINELLVSTGKEVVLNIAMQQANSELSEVVVRGSKDTPLNSMTTLSARQFTVEETQRYAGGMDDPARLVTSFAGVVSPSIGSSGISVRGNTPAGLLWRIEGVEVPNPNHFADLTIAGGGMLTAISSQMMGNSDFFTGAFPAEYGNASSGVFDIKLNSGNSAKRQYTAQIGLLGTDIAAQGPFVKGKEATYNINYRYSTMALVAPVLPDDAGILKYQDLCFKSSFPTKKLGTLSFWGIGALDGVDMEANDSSDWESEWDKDDSQTTLNMFATGLTHKININPSTFLNSTISASGNGLSHKEQRLDMNLQPHAQSDAVNQLYRIAIQSNISKRFGNRHSNKTGFNYQYLGYHLKIQQSPAEGFAIAEIVNENGNSGLIQGFTQSKFNMSPKLTLNVGLNTQYFLLNNNFAVEPRAGIKYELTTKQSIAFSYGLHSRIEQLPLYFIESAGTYPNKDLEFMKSSHFVFSYVAKLNETMLLTVEPYYQKLSNIPVSPVNYISIINNQNALYFNETLCSDGKGHNVGIDLTLEKFLDNGFYYLISTSLYDSKYTPVDGIERNTRYNKNYVANIVGGKEWIVGQNKDKIVGVNARFNYMGGNRLEPVNQELSIQNKTIEYGETDGNLAFEDKSTDNPILSITLSYRKNKPKYSSMWALQVLNVTKSEEFAVDYYNIKTGAIDSKYQGIMIPNISYKIEF